MADAPTDSAEEVPAVERERAESGESKGAERKGQEDRFEDEHAGKKRACTNKRMAENTQQAH